MRWVAVTVLTALCLQAQRNSGELRIAVTDPAGAAIEASGKLTGDAAGVRREFTTAQDGRATLRSLPFGPYRLEVSRPGFATFATNIEIASERPLSLDIPLALEAVETTLTVRSATLLDPTQTGSQQHIGASEIEKRQPSSPGRSVIDLVNQQPGWLLEANGVLHPRGSEYQVQYVLDGMPMFDNRSPAFAQLLSASEFESIEVRTGGYPAEYGRKLGGVIELRTERDVKPGFHGHVSGEGGSFGTAAGFASGQWSTGKTTIGVSLEGFLTDRYLDPPVERNYTNHASAVGESASFERDWSASDRTRFYFEHRRTGFLVPNELLQQAAGQRQDRTAGETLGQVSHQHIFSPSVLAFARLRIRDTSGALWSNPLSTPIAPTQDRSVRETYASSGISWRWRKHEIKAGADAIFSSVNENFGFQIVAYRIQGVRIFDRELPPSFQFNQFRRGTEPAAYVQDQYRIGPLTLSAGIRWDGYRMVANETAWSPRLGAAYHLAAAGLVLRAAYDRTFESPAIENVLLGSANLISVLGGEGLHLPLRPARGNFLEAGFSKTLGRSARLDGTWYRRRVDNFQDDDLLLNTGVSFPIAFARGEVSGYEARLELPRWGRFTSSMSYTNMIGRGFLPVAGGLFLGDEADLLTISSGSFPISQDQRNTVRALVRAQISSRLWVAGAGRYNSGLPVEFEGTPNLPFLMAQYGPDILGRVNFDRGRVRPSVAIDLEAGLDAIRRETFKVQLTGGVRNAGDRLNVVNFAGILSGTAIEAPRSVSVRMSVSF